MRNIMIATIFVLSSLLVTGTSDSNSVDKNKSTKCPYLNQIQENSGSNKCPFLNQVQDKPVNNKCPFSGKIRSNEGDIKENSKGKCPYSGGKNKQEIQSKPTTKLITT